MPSLALILQAVQILTPVIEELVKALETGKVPDFIDTIPDPLRSQVALNARKALGR